MTCEECRASLVDLVYEEASPEEERRLHAHLEGCEGCRRELETLRRVAGLLDRWQEIPLPVHPAPVRMPEPGPSGVRSRVFSPRWLPGWRIAGSLAAGACWALLSLFLLRSYLVASQFPDMVHIFLGAFSAAIGSSLFYTAFGTRPGPTAYPEAAPLARGVLLGAPAACLLLALGPAPWTLAGFGGPGEAAAALRPEALAGVYLLYGAGFGFFGLFAGCVITGRGVWRASLTTSAAGTCLFLLAIAPGLVVVSIPFTVGTYAPLLGGSALGGLGGSTLGLGLRATHP
ncbi:MAG: zf-HC2 domain-containing protein [candidate division NC10 bacterium]|nr:zf-HC2 domain-containing protein [candidate division NC10 bacterium]